MELTPYGVVEGFNDSATEKITLTFEATLPNGTVVKRTVQLSFRILDSLPTSPRNIYYEYDVKALYTSEGTLVKQAATLRFY